MNPVQTPEQLESNFKSLQNLCRVYMPVTVYEPYVYMLEDLKNDVGELAGFKRAPAAKGNHHAFEGGLVIHLLEMWAAWLRIRESYSQFTSGETDPFISDERVLRAIINHDLHKGHRTFKIISTDPWQVDYANDPTDMLMTTDVKSMWLLMKYKVPMDPEQLNALCWAEGGFASIKPKWCSVLSKLCYLLDEMSGNVINRIAQRTYLNHREPIPNA